MPARTLSRLVVFCIAAAALLTAIERIRAPMADLSIRSFRVGETPVTEFALPDLAADAPAVVIAHGFAGSRQLMHPVAVTLANAGHRAFVFDFPGHGRHPSPLTGSITDPEGATRVLVAATLEVVTHARSSTTGPLALVGHSMATDVIVRAADEARPDATALISMFSPAATAERPPNALVVVGALEPGMLGSEARRVVNQVASLDDPGEVAPGTTYGRWSEGTARRLVVAPGVEHISVLYSETMLTATRDWLDGLPGTPDADAVPRRLDRRGPWIAVLLAATVALAWPLARLLPEVTPERSGAGRGWRTLWPVLVVPMLVTPLVLRFVPTGFLPILVGDYLAVHFGLYGILTVATLAASRAPFRSGRAATRPLALGVAGLAVAAYGTFAFGGAIDFSFANFRPGPGRWPLIAAMLAGTLPFYLATEWATRGPGAARGGHPAAKAAFLVSLAIAVALDVERLFFLIIIVPAILIFFGVLGLFAEFAYRRTRHPLPGGFGIAMALAWALGVTFPMLGG